MNKTRTAEDNWRAFGKEWFAKHQRKILWCLNAPVIGRISRWILRIDKDCPKAEIIDIKPNCYTIRGEKEDEYTTDFRTHWKFAKRIYFAFRPMWWAMHTWDEIFADKYSPELSFGFDTLTAYPDTGNPGETTVDGFISRYSATGETFSTIVAGAGTSVYDTSMQVRLTEHATTSSRYVRLHRAFCHYDTSSLTADSIISNVVLSLYLTKANSFASSPLTHIIESTIISDNTLTTLDFVNTGSVDFGSIAYDDLNSSVYNDFTLNESGIANVSKTGVSKFASKSSWDFTRTGPAWEGGKEFRLTISPADNEGTDNDPKLTVTYTLPGGGSTFIPKITFID